MCRNIVQLYLIKAAKWFMLAMPVIMLFYESAHLDVQQVFILKAVYSVMVVLCEIPSGYLSDVWGRKNALVLGTVFGAMGYGCYATSSGFWFFLIAEILLGIGQSCISGSDSALLYDTLKDEQRTSDYLLVEGRITSWGNLLEAVAGVLAGLLATYSIRYPMIGQAFVSLIGIPAALMLREPSSSSEHRIASFGEVVQVVKSSFVEHIALRNALLFSSIIGTATLTMAWLLQLLFKEMSIPVSQYGVLWTGLNLLVAWGSIRAFYIEKRIQSRWLSVIILIGVVGGYLAVGLVSGYWVFTFVIIFYLTRGVATPTLKNMVNQRTTSSIRATVLSIRNFLIRILFAVIGPILGGVTDRLGLHVSMVLMAIIVFILGSVVLMMENQRRKRDEI
ncbi:MFS transporter [Halosquirtibacter xylanolyticus]|uniref:MFS transporter n=1 Tax=Halosquirtibacter xylanolyticus TaxID=3374599 RepID=UPI003749CD00|nr:MFS transporter [Prolixibacteraceae bacterium]